jgi:hypothetical protein
MIGRPTRTAFVLVLGAAALLGALAACGAESTSGERTFRSDDFAITFR